MKKLSISFLAIVISMMMNIGLAGNPNAVYLHEGFNGSGIPAGWNQFRISGTQAAWSVVGQGSNPTVNPYAGSGQAKFNSFDAASGEQARLVSPRINLSISTDPFLTFFMYHDDEYLSSLDSVYVEASTNDSVSGPWTTLLGARRPRTTEGWTKELASLYSLRGASRVFLSLRGVSKYGSNMFADEFRVADSSFHDIGVARLLPANNPTSAASLSSHMNQSRTSSSKESKTRVQGKDHQPVVALPYSSQLNIRAIVQNRGTFTVSSYTVAWQLDGQSQPPAVGGSVEPRSGRDTVVLTWNNPTPGLHTIVAWTVLATDSNRANDTSRITFQVLEAGTVFYESFNDGAFPPAGWSVINRDGGALAPWFRGADTSAFLAFEGSGYAANNFQRSNGTYLDDYLITPPISGVAQPGTVDSLVFWTRSQFNLPPAPNFPDSMLVLVSTTGIDPSHFTLQLEHFPVPKSGWTRKAYSLAGRVPANSTVRIAFRYLLYNVQPASGSGDFVGIDAVQLIRRLPASVEEHQNKPPTFVLEQNYPNPFNPSTKIGFKVQGSGLVFLKVYDVLGREVATLVNEELKAGSYVTTFDATALSSGVYLYRLTSGGLSLSRKLLITK